MARTRDSQKERCYKWESMVEKELRKIVHPEYAKRSELTDSEAQDSETFVPAVSLGSLIFGAQLSEKGVKELVYKLRWQGKLKKSPRIDFVESGSSSYRFSDHRIRLIPEHRSAWVVTHEMCHAILCHQYHYNYSPKLANHGREFVGLLMHFMEKNFNIPFDLMATVANTARVDFAQFTTKDLK